MNRPRHLHLKSLAMILGILAPIFMAMPASAGDNYSFKHINGNNGLSSSNVKCIAEDSFGFMWFGTKNGLNLYDGVRMRLLDCYDEALKQGNDNIGALYEDKDKNMWVGTDRGVYIYNPLTDRFSKSVAADPETGEYASNWVQSIVGDGKGHVWVLIPDQGVFYYHDAGKVDF